MRKEIKLNIPKDKLDFIYHVKSALSFNECNNIIKFYDDNEKYHRYGTLTADTTKEYSKLKKCTEVFISTDLLIESEYFKYFDSTIINSST